MSANQAELERQVEELQGEIESLRRREERWRTFIEQANDLIFTLGTDGRIATVNRAVCATLGYSEDELLNQSSLALVAPEARETVAEALARVLQGYNIDRMEIEAITKQGRRLVLDVRGRILRDEGGVIGTFHIAREVTERKRAEQAAREQRALSEALRDTAAALNGSLNSDEVLDRILANVNRVVPYDAVDVMLVEEGATRIARCRGYAERGLTDWVYALRLRIDDITNLRRMRDTGRPVVVTDTRADPDWVEIPRLNWQRSYLGTPIRFKGQVVGFLNLISTTAGFYTQAHADHLRAFADQAALAIENARLFEAEREQHALAEALRDTAAALNATLDFDEVLDRILTSAGLVVPHDSASVLLIESEAARVVRSRGLGVYGTAVWTAGTRFEMDDASLLRQMIRTGEPLVLPDLRSHTGWPAVGNHEWARSFVAAPIRSDREAVGFLTLVSDTPEFYTGTHAQRLSIFADQAAVAIQNARLHQSVLRASDSRAVLYRASQEMAASLDPEQVYAATHRAVEQLMPAEAFAITLLNEAQQVVELAYLIDHSGRVTAPPQPIDRGLTGQLLATGRSVRIDDTEQESDTDVVRFGDPEDVRSLVAVPMRQGDRVIGMLSTQSYRSRAYTHDDEQVLTLLANHAAGAIVNARLFSSERAAREQAEVLSQVAQAVGGSLDRNEVLRRSLVQLRRVLNFDTASVFVFGEGIRAELIAGSGYDNESMTSHSAARLLESSPILRQMAVDLEPVLNLDVRDLDGWIWVPGAEHVRSFLAVPLIARDRMIGALMFDSRQIGFFDAAAMQIAQRVAGHVAVAVENARLFEIAQRRLAEQAALLAASTAVTSSLDLKTMLNRLAEQMGRAIDVTSVYISDWNPDTGESAIVAEYYGADATPNERISDVGVTYILPRDFGDAYALPLQMGRIAIHHLDDPALSEPARAHYKTYDAQSVLAVPLIVKDVAVGYVELWESRRRRDFAPEEIALCEGIARQAAVAFDNVRLFDAERQRRQELEAIHQASLSLAASLDLPQVLNAILASVLNLVPLLDAHIFLYDGQRLTFGAATMRDGRLSAPYTEPRPAGMTYSVARSGEVIVVANSKTHPLYADAPPDWMPFAIVGLPLKIGSTVVGVMNVAYPSPRRFAESELRILNLLAAQAAIAVHNARLHEQVQHHAADLERRVAERTAELDRQRRRMQAILDAAGEGIVFTDLQGQIEYLNPALQRITGYAAGETLGQNPRMWQSGRTPQSTYKDMWQRIARGEVWQGELINRRKDGALYDAAMTVTPLTDADGRTIGYVGVQRDITRQKDLDRLKDQFVSNVSHELRTPLANVKLYLGLLEHGRADKREQYMQTLQRETLRLEKLISDLLDLSRLDLGNVPMHLVDTDLNQLAADLIVDRAALAVEHGLTLDCQPDARLPVALADPTMVAQVMSNLMANAIHYTPGGGMVTVTTGVRRADDGEWVTFTVQDTGPGLSDEDLPHLFERFYRGTAGRQSGAPGTGLGLAICKEIVDKMEGRITIDNRPAQGAAFTVWLRPLRDAA